MNLPLEAGCAPFYMDMEMVTWRWSEFCSMFPSIWGALQYVHGDGPSLYAFSRYGYSTIPICGDISGVLLFISTASYSFSWYAASTYDPFERRGIILLVRARVDVVHLRRKIRVLAGR